MAASISRFISGIAFICTAALTPAMAATTAQGGVIHFRGQIVEDPCVVNPQHQKFALTCPQNGRMQTTHISYQDATDGHHTSANTVQVSMKYPDPEKKLAVVELDYR